MSVPDTLTFITIGAHDLPALRRFYRSWGWTELDGGSDGFAQFAAGPVRLALFPVDQLGHEAAPGAPLPVRGQWNGMTLAINVPSRESVDAAFAEATACGATPVAVPLAREWGGYSGYVADPEGTRWEIAWLPGLYDA